MHYDLFPLQEKTQTQEMCLGMQIMKMRMVSAQLSPHMQKCTARKCTVSIHCFHMCVVAGQNVLSKTDGEIVQHVSLWVKKKTLSL